jgi:DNA-binding NarL/FixJ family response regulator
MHMKLLLVDDHSILREGVAEILRQSEARTEVLQAQTIAQGLTLAAQHDDLTAILLDISFPGASGLSGIGEFAAITSAPVIILSSSEDASVVRQALHLGARGYVAKSATSQTLMAALHKVLAGQVHIPPFAQVGEIGSARSGLTQRQLEVLQAICGGLSNKDIGLKLELSEKTVKVHVTAIFRALNVVNRTQAVNAARAAKLIAG